MRVALYARYSSDQQREASIADQLRDCRAFAMREGWTVVREYHDSAMSGASRHRPGLQSLLLHAAGEYDIVIAESLDRLSRDQEDTAAVHKRLAFVGVRIITLAEGENSVNRALEAKARALAGLKGYTTNLAACPDGTPVTAEFVIGAYRPRWIAYPPGESRPWR